MESGAGFIMDIITAGILLLSAFWGSRKGLARTVSSFMQWFLCIILGILFCGAMKDLLSDYTQLDETLSHLLTGHIENTLEESSSYAALPDLFSSWLDRSAGSLSTVTAETISDTLMTVISFLTIILGIKLLGFLLVQGFSRKYNDGITGFIDGFLGFLFGLARGLLLALLFFALLVPVLMMIWPEVSAPLMACIDNSYAAKLFYDENVLLILVRDFSKNFI